VTIARTRLGHRPAALTGLLALALATAIPVASGPAGAAPIGRIWWSSASPGTPYIDSALHAVAARSATDVWAVGWQSTGAEDLALVHHWNGTLWKSVATPDTSAVSVQLAGVDFLPSGDAIAVGSTTGNFKTTPVIHRYPAGGGAGQEIPGPVPATGGAWQGIDLLSDTDGWAVGMSGSQVEGEPAQTLIAHWTGAAWKEVPSPSPGTLSSRLTAVTAIAANDVYAVGQVRDVTDPKIEKSLVLHWDGVSWSQVASPNPGLVRTTLLAVDAAGPGELWAVGYTLDTLTDDPDPDELLHPVALYLSGGIWRVLRSTQATATEYTGVVAIGPRDVVLAGYQVVAGSETNNIEEWNGGSFTHDSVDPGTNSGEHIGSALSGIAAEPNGGRLWAVGWSANLSAMQQPHSLRSDH